MKDLKRVDLQISGMTCAACAQRIEKVLRRTNGIHTVNVNFAVERATIEYAQKELTFEAIENKIRNLGFGVTKGREKNESLYRSRALTIRFIAALLLSIPFFICMVVKIDGLPFDQPLIQLLLATPVQFLLAKPFYLSAWRAIKSKAANMDVLVVLSTSTAYLYSLYLLLVSKGSPTRPLYFDTTVLIITYILLGKLLEERAKRKTKKSITHLYKLQEKQAIVIKDHREYPVDVKDVQVGDHILVKPGQMIPLDGQVIDGNSAIDESMLTGESIPVDKSLGDSVYGGALNTNGAITISVTKKSKDTMLAQLIHIVENAQGSKAPIQRLADQMSEVFVPIVLVTALITFIAWYFLFLPEDIGLALQRAITVLIIACPCALGLATPTSILVGSGRSAQMGILFREGKNLEALERMDVVVFDKTGTLTMGKPELTNVSVLDMGEKEFWRYVGAVERNSEHPIAQAICQYLHDKHITFPPAFDFESFPGRGASAVVNGKKVRIGTISWMSNGEIQFGEEVKHMMQTEEKGKTVVAVSIDDEFKGWMAVSDTIKPNARSVIRALKQMGKQVYMVTGDNERTAHAIGKEVGIKRIFAGVLPHEKVGIIKAIQKEGKKVTMIGDGVNDAPALTVSEIGIALGTGADLTIHASDIHFLRGDLSCTIDAFHLSKMTMKNIRQNLFSALVYNVVMIPMAMIGLLTPEIAALAMACSSISVILNALRLQTMKI